MEAILARPGAFDIAGDWMRSVGIDVAWESEEVIANLVRLARMAEREEKGMFLWGSL